MSTLKVNNLQVGQDSTATNNLTWFQPGSPDGTIRLGSGNAGSATSKFTFDKDGNLTCVGDITANSIIAPIEGTLDDWIVHAGDTNTKFGYPANDQFQVQTGGTERFSIYASTSGNGGIAKFTTPTSGDMLNLQNSTASGQGLIFGVDTSASPGYTYWKNNTTASYDAAFIVGGSERLRIKSDGDVTITSTDAGATGPTLKLLHNSASPADNDIVGVISMHGDDDAGNETEFASINTKVTDVSNGTEQAHLSFYTRGLGSRNEIFRLVNRSSASAPSYTTDDHNGIILDVYNTGNPYPRYMNLIAKSAGNTDSNIGFWTEKVGGSPTEKLRITATGVVSINDSTPETWATLQVNNHSTHNAAQVLIRGADQAQIILRDDTGGTDTKCTTIRNDQGALIFGQHNDAFSAFSENLRIGSNGNVSIGLLGSSGSTSSAGYDELLIEAGNEDIGMCFLTPAANNKKQQISFGDSNNNQVGRIVYNHNGDSLAFYANNNPGLTVLSNGKLMTQSAGFIYSSSSAGSLTLAGGNTNLGGTIVLSGGNASSTGDIVLKTGMSTATPSERVHINNVGNVLIKNSTTSASGSHENNVPLCIDGGTNKITLMLGDASTSVSGHGVNDYSGDIRFNGANVAWGDISYYPNGNGAGGSFRFTRNGSTVTSVPNASIGVQSIFIGGNADAQRLDDYEEGQWTPKLMDGNGSNVTFTAGNDCYYVKVGTLVFCYFSVTRDETGSKSGNMAFWDLPFTTHNTALQVTGTWWLDESSPSAGDAVGGAMYLSSNAKRAYFVYPTNEWQQASTRYLQFSQWTNGRPCYGSFTYRAQT